MESHVSVILPYYNRADTLLDASRSVLEQTHRDLTLYLVNDGSTDGSQETARSLADDRIVHLNCAMRGGAPRARNVGIDAARSRLIAFMDSDDLWLPQKLEGQIALLSSTRDQGVGIVGCAWRQEPKSRTKKAFTLGPFDRAHVLRHGVAGVSTQMLLADFSVAEPTARFDDTMPALEERSFLLDCLSNGSKVAIAPEVMAIVRRGRSDHVASHSAAALAYEMLLDRYGQEMDEPTRSGFAFSAAREHLRARSLRGVTRHVRSATAFRTARRSVHIAFGAALGERGLAIAERVLPRR
jgi:glycosyltransferase involved in cell wall biosynthesis